MNSLENEKKLIEKFLTEEFEIIDSNIAFEIPKDLTNADLVLTTAMKYAKVVKIPPSQMASKIVDFINTNIHTFANFKKVSVAEPGFINIFLTNNFIRENIFNKDVVKTKYTGRKVLVEQCDDNDSHFAREDHFI